MIAAHDVRMNFRVDHAAFQPFGHDEIIDSPAGVPRARRADIAPPAVSAGRSRIKIAEAVDESGTQETSELCALLIGKASAFMICRWMEQLTWNSLTRI